MKETVIKIGYLGTTDMIARRSFVSKDNSLLLLVIGW